MMPVDGMYNHASNAEVVASFDSNVREIRVGRPQDDRVSLHLQPFDTVFSVEGGDHDVSRISRLTGLGDQQIAVVNLRAGHRGAFRVDGEILVLIRHQIFAQISVLRFVGGGGGQAGVDVYRIVGAHTQRGRQAAEKAFERPAQPLTQGKQVFDFRAADFAIFNPAESRGADADNTFQIPER